MAVIYEATAKFEQDGLAYQPGDEFVPPHGWERVEKHPTLGERLGPDQTIFGQRVQIARTKDRQPVYDTRVIVLPVRAKG